MNQKLISLILLVLLLLVPVDTYALTCSQNFYTAQEVEENIVNNALVSYIQFFCNSLYANINLIKKPN